MLRRHLKDLCQAAKKMGCNTSPNPIVKAVCIRNGHAMVANAGESYSVPIDETCECLIPFEVVDKVSRRKGPGNEIHIHESCLVDGNKRTSFNGYDMSNYLTNDSFNKKACGTIKSDMFLDALEEAEIHVSDDPTRPMLACVQIGPDGMDATDGKTWFHQPYITLPTKYYMEYTPFLKTLRQRRISFPLSVYVRYEGTPAAMRIVSPDGVACSFNLTDGAFPKRERIVPSNISRFEEIDIGPFKEDLLLLCKEAEKDRIQFSQNSVTNMETEVPIDFPDTTVAFNAKVLADMIKRGFARMHIPPEEDRGGIVRPAMLSRKKDEATVLFMPLNHPTPWYSSRDEDASCGDASEPQWRCTVCGQVGTVGRCCGRDTREPVNDAARAE